MTTTSGQLPDSIGGYVVLRRIGHGGMGDIYEAVQANPQRHVALKVIRPDRASPDYRQRFATEVQALGRLRHPGIARIYEGGHSADGRPYFAMELVDGLPIDSFIVTNQTSLRGCLSMLVDIAAALKHAHDQDVVHCDLKPANIIVEPGGIPRILDFGVARILNDASASNTDSGGTLQYMSPEQIEGDNRLVNRRSDIYSLGVIAFQVLSGRLPYTVSHDFVIARDTLRTVTAPPLSGVDPRLSGDFERIVAKALNRDIEKRYGSAAEFGTDLRRAAHGHTSTVSKGTLREGLRRLLLQPEVVRRAGWFGVAVASGVAVFQGVYAAIGVVNVFDTQLSILPPSVRQADFLTNTIGWTLMLSAMAYMSHRVVRGSGPALYAVLGITAALLLFALSVLFGFNSYDGGGILRDPVLRVGTYMLLTLAALGSTIVFLLALLAMRKQQWFEEPPTGTPKSDARLTSAEDASTLRVDIRHVLVDLLAIRPPQREEWLQQRYPDDPELRRRLIGAVGSGAGESVTRSTTE